MPSLMVETELFDAYSTAVMAAVDRIGPSVLVAPREVALKGALHALGCVKIAASLWAFSRVARERPRA